MDSNISAWTSGGAIFTFAPLYLLVLAVAAGLLVLYIKPSVIPGRRSNHTGDPVIANRRPGKPTGGG
jgi:hypothetical protein